MKAIIPALATLLLAGCIASPMTEPAPRPTAPPGSPSPSALPPTEPAVASLTPAAAATAAPSERVSAADYMPQVFVPAGMVRMGGLDVRAEDDELPAHSVELEAFWLDKLEVTNGMFALCVQAGACPPPVLPSSNKRPDYFGNPEFQDYPVVHVPWGSAQAYCAWAGRRLPTEAEWERAARGDDFRTWPWGDEPPSGHFANFDWLTGDTSRVGSYAAGAGPFGALDLAGNVWEWTADIYNGEYYKASPLTDPTGPQEAQGNLRRVIRGGSFEDVDTDLRVSNRGYELGPDPRAPFAQPVERAGNDSFKIGFRCAADE
jgi:serine/threonine-protein kinase